MTADELLTTLASRGVRVRVDGESLCLRPRELLTPDLLDACREAKYALLDRLRHNADAVPDPISARVVAFRKQGQPWVLIPNLPYERSRCFSCGAPLIDVVFGRCLACSEALWRALMNESIAPWARRPH